MNTCRKILCLLDSAFVVFSYVPVAYEEEAVGFVAAFVSEHASMDIYYTQVYAQADETDVSTVLARNIETGEMDRLILRSTWKKNM